MSLIGSFLSWFIMKVSVNQNKSLKFICFIGSSSSMVALPTLYVMVGRTNSPIFLFLCLMGSL